MAKPASQIRRDLGLVFRGIISVGLYLCGVISGLIYLFNHFLILGSPGGSWYCSGPGTYDSVTKQTRFIKCDPSWYSNEHFHLGLMFGIIGTVALTILLLVALFAED